MNKLESADNSTSIKFAQFSTFGHLKKKSIENGWQSRVLLVLMVIAFCGKHIKL